MKKIIVFLLLIQTAIRVQAQNIPYETLDSLSAAISKMQSGANELIYTHNKTDYELSFPEANFQLAFHDRLATKSLYLKWDGTEILALNENIDLSKAIGITVEPSPNKILLVVKLHFPVGYLKTQIIENGILKNTVDENFLELFEKYYEKTSNPTLFTTLSDLCNRLRREKGLITEKEIEEENMDWKSLSREAYIQKHPGSIKTMQAKLAIENKRAQDKYEIERTIAYMDSLTNAFKIRIGMTEEEYKQQNPEIATEVFKKKNSYITDGGSYKSYRSKKKYPQIERLIFKREKLAEYWYYLACNGISGRVETFNKFVASIKLNVASKYITVNSDKNIIIYHPVDNWILHIDYRPDLDAYSNGINLRVHFYSSK